MNIREYISSGIIESYVLGMTTPEESAEFERLASQHPELREARDEFERLLEARARENAIAPPPGLFEKIDLAAAPASPVVPMPATPRTGWGWKIAAAACFLLFAGSMYWNWQLKNENQELQKDLVATSTEVKKTDTMMAAIDQIIPNPGIRMAHLDPMPISPQANATVYWDTTSRDVFLAVKNLPSPPSTHQYQLWALLDGKPLDMGTLEITEKPLQLYRMKNVQKAQAFAITLEKRGGSPQPEGEMYLMGKL